MRVKSVCFAASLVLVSGLSLMACSGPVKELDEHINLKDEIILEMGKKIEASPTEAGVDEARKVYESKKDELKAKCAALRGKKLNSDQTTRLIDSAVTNDKMLDLIKSKIQGTEAHLKFTALINEFNRTCK